MRNYYYLGLAPDYDVTLEGSYATKQGPFLGGEVRRRFDKGQFNVTGTVTEGDYDTQTTTKNDKVRGHFFADSEYDFNDHWRAGYKGGYASDPSYLRFYRISQDDIIRNRAYAERFDQRDYVAVNAYAFQDLRPNRPGDQPNVLPQGTASYLGDPGSFLGGRWRADADLLSIARDSDSQNVQRTSLDLSWQRRFVSTTGLVAVADIKGEGDLYAVQNADTTFVPAKANQDYTTSRFYPEAQLTMRYPMAKNYDESRALIEPTVAYTAIPRVKNTNIPNEDSQNLELDSTNLFSLNRFPGLDRVDDSNRVTYGLKGAYDQADGFYSSLFFGQSYNLNELRNVDRSAGLDKDFTDYIGEFHINPNEYVDANYRVRLDHDDFTPRQHELNVSAGAPILRVSGNYVLADQLASDSFTRERRQQVNYTAVTQITPQWSFGIYDTRNIGKDSGGLVSGAMLKYLDECFSFQIIGQRDFTERVGIDTGDTIYFQFSFRNLGDFASPTLSPDLWSRDRSLSPATTSTTTSN